MKAKTFFAWLLLLATLQSKIFSQAAYIYGNGNVAPGAQEYYEAQFDIQPQWFSMITWTVAGGTKVSENVNPTQGTIYIIVQWDNNPGTGYISIYEDPFGQYGDRTVFIGDPLNGGNISTANPYFNFLNPVPAITENPAWGGNCAGNYNYAWEASPNGINWAYIGNGENYPANAPALTDKTYVRRTAECNGEVQYSNVLFFNYQPINWENRNFIRTNEILYAGKTNFISADNLPIGAKQQTTIFFDGLGRSEQKVITGASPANKDLVSPVEYDALGRELNKHLAYPASAGDGKFEIAALADQQAFMSSKYPGENHFYAETRQEASPLNRTLKVLAPGSNWGGNSVGISTTYELNKTIDAVRIWRIDNFSSSALPVSNAGDVYPENSLYKTTTTDENGKRIIDYKDKDGLVILRKQQNASSPLLDENHKGWLCTYYVYNDFGRLRYMITPKAVKKMDDSNNWVLTQQMADGLCYKYVYDARGRLLEKKNPDANPEYNVYDSRDRLIFSQHGNQKAGRTNNYGYPEWTFYVYDAQNRQVASGVFIENATNFTQASLQSFVNTDPSLNSGNRSIAIQTDATESLTAFNPVPLFSGTPSLPQLDYYAVNVNSITYYDNNQASYSVVALPYAANFENIDPQTPSQRVRGLATATKSRTLDGGNSFRKTSSIYDEKGRVIQVSVKNVLNQNTSTTTQYDFSGRIRGNVYLESNSAGGYINTTSKYEFDHAGRPRKTFKSVTHLTSGAFGATTFSVADKLVAEHNYDELGQLQSKTLAPGYAGPNGPYIEKLDYDYNIRGWMTGINKSYVSGSSPAGHFFGIELGFDKPGSQGFINPLLNGNVAGMAWKTAGDNIARKFDYQYDNSNRLIQADFKQKNSYGATWTKDKMDFSVPVIQYDANGNITRMEQQGVNFSGIVPMDKITYGYNDYSNKLNWVAEDAGSSDYKLGDFTDRNTGANNIDYTYDENGNLNKDNNKGISNIKYNYLDLPEYIDIPGKGYIKYIYDAAGNKLQKIVTDNTPATGAVINTTTYSGPVVYTGNDIHINFEEGRIRHRRDPSTNLPIALVFDYYIKDHLGNVRMVLTEETQTNIYPPATMETASAALEDKYYYINNRTDKPAALQGNPQYDRRYGLKMSKLSSIAGTNKIGPSILLKVMAGDMIQAKSDYYYQTNGSQVNSATLLDDLISNLLIHLNKGQAGGTAKAQSGIIGNSVQNNGIAQGLITQQNNEYNSSRPKAFINYIVFDEQFNAVARGFKQVENPGPLQPPIVRSDIPITQNGWIYVFVNNESQQAVYFDNFQVIHARSNILEETHYYPFGLVMKAISPRSLSVYPVNKHKFNDKELQSEEFSDGTSLDEYDFGARYYDPQIGRWNGPDPMAEKFPNVSPYSYASNNPVLFVDKNGKFIHLILKYGINVAINIGIQMITSYMFDPDVHSWGDAWDEASVWDALWESASDMIGSRALRMAGDAIQGIFHYIDDVGFSNVSAGGLFKAGFTGVLEPLVWKFIGKYGAAAVERGLNKIGLDQKAINKLLGRPDPVPVVPKFKLSKELEKRAEKDINKSGKTVLGHSKGPGRNYVDKAKDMKASYFYVEKASWDALSEQEQRAMNRHFLEVIAERGDQVYLSIPKKAIGESTPLDWEIDTLIKEFGYKWINQWSLVKQ